MQDDVKSEEKEDASRRQRADGIRSRGISRRVRPAWLGM